MRTWTIDSYTVWSAEPGELSPGDMAVFAKGLKSCFSVKKKTALEALMRAHYILWISKERPDPLAFCTLAQHVLPDGQILYEIWNVCTLAEHRRRGYATALFRQIIEIAAGASLWLLVESKANVNLYTKLGFVRPSIVSESATGEDLGRRGVELIYKEGTTGPEREAARDEALAMLHMIEDYNLKDGLNYIEMSRPSLVEIYYGGRLLNPKYEYGGNVYMDPKGHLAIGDVVRGDTASVMIPCNDMRFHTHPVVAYEKVKIGVNPMSHQDLIAEVFCASSLGIVFALEGIYSYQLNPNLHSMFKLWKILKSELLDVFINAFREELADHVNEVFPQYQQLYNHLGFLVDAWKKAHPGRAPDLLEIVNSDAFIDASHAHIFKILAAYGDVTLGRVIRRDRTKQLQLSLSPLDANMKLFRVNFTPNVYNLLKARKPVYVGIYF